MVSLLILGLEKQVGQPQKQNLKFTQHQLETNTEPRNHTFVAESPLGSGPLFARHSHHQGGTLHGGCTQQTMNLVTQRTTLVSRMAIGYFGHWGGTQQHGNFPQTWPASVKNQLQHIHRHDQTYLFPETTRNHWRSCGKCSEPLVLGASPSCSCTSASSSAVVVSRVTSVLPDSYPKKGKKIRGNGPWQGGGSGNFHKAVAALSLGPPVLPFCSSLVGGLPY